MPMRVQVGELPQGHVDKYQSRRAAMLEGKAEDKAAPDNVPFLDLKSSGVVKSDEEHEVGAGWRKLARPDIPH